MTPLELEAIIALAQKLFSIMAEAKAALAGIQKNVPEAYATADKRHREAGKHLDDSVT